MNRRAFLRRMTALGCGLLIPEKLVTVFDMNPRGYGKPFSLDDVNDILQADYQEALREQLNHQDILLNVLQQQYNEERKVCTVPLKMGRNEAPRSASIVQEIERNIRAISEISPLVKYKP